VWFANAVGSGECDGLTSLVSILSGWKDDKDDKDDSATYCMLQRAQYRRQRKEHEVDVCVRDVESLTRYAESSLPGLRLST
jgi:hypothetical protein